MPFSIFPVFRRSALGAGLALVTYLLVAGSIIGYAESSRIEQERSRVASIAGERALAIQLNIEQALSSAYALATMVQLGKGELPGFASVTQAMRAFYPGIAALQLAPDGVIRQIEPLAGNEKALGHNLLADPERDKEAIRARDTGKLTLAGPFALVQGGLGAAGRLPVYLKDEKGGTRFWGFVIVLIRFPDALAPARLRDLVLSGYQYEISRVHPDTGKKHVIAASSGKLLVNPVARSLQVPNATWTLSLAPTEGWIDRTGVAIKAALALFILMLAVLGWRKPFAW